MKITILFLFVFTVVLAACSSNSQPELSQNGIGISQARILLPGGNAMSGMDPTLVAYMSIKNTSTTSDRLTGVKVDFAEASLHETTMEGDVMKMNAITGVDIPAGQMVELRSGSYHIMFMSLTKPLKVGDTVNIVLIFEKAGKITIPVKVTDK